jgi:hypothetical protein
VSHTGLDALALESERQFSGLPRQRLCDRHALLRRLATPKANVCRPASSGSTDSHFVTHAHPLCGELKLLTFQAIRIMSGDYQPIENTLALDKQLM